MALLSALDKWPTHLPSGFISPIDLFSACSGLALVKVKLTQAGSSGCSQSIQEATHGPFLGGGYVRVCLVMA